MHPQVPNALTVSRMALAAAFPFVEPRLRLWVLSAALATEYLDGALSRRYRLESRLGQILDPLADKMLFIAVAATFFLEGRVALWEIVLLALRDLAVFVWALRAAASRNWSAFGLAKPNRLGRVTTALQYACFFGLLLQRRLHPALLAVTTLVGALAVREYFRERPEANG